MFKVETVQIIAALAVFAILLTALVFMRRKAHISFTIRTLLALVLGAGFGIALQGIFGAETSSGAGAEVKKWINIIAQLFSKSLQMLVVPLVLVSIINAVNKFSSQKEGVQKALRIIGFLLATTAVSAFISIFFTRLFGLSASNLIDYKASESKTPDVAATLLNLIPGNVFAALSSNSVLPVVLFAALAGFVTLALKKERPEIAERINAGLEFAQSFVLKAAHIIINFTPYGILAIITVRAASGSGAFIIQLGAIIAACFVALGAVFVLHLIIAAVTGTSPSAYLKAGAPALFFAFSSRSSAATVPLTISAQKKLGVGDANANLAAAFGTCIGQNGCAGVYPTMLAILVGLVQGWDVWSIGFLLPLAAYVVLASIGTAGVGGGATNVSLLVLSLLGLPVELVAILISVDFIIDMGRTLVNVSDSILAGLIAEKQERTGTGSAVR